MNISITPHLFYHLVSDLGFRHGSFWIWEAEQLWVSAQVLREAGVPGGTAIKTNIYIFFLKHVKGKETREEIKFDCIIEINYDYDLCQTLLSRGGSAHRITSCLGSLEH